MGRAAEFRLPEPGGLPEPGRLPEPEGWRSRKAGGAIAQNEKNAFKPVACMRLSHSQSG